jgi:hypothetical protein
VVSYARFNLLIKLNGDQLFHFIFCFIRHHCRLKRVLCDSGWKNVYNALLASKEDDVQDSINCWLPPGTRLREEIELISARHPLGFETTYETSEGKESMAEILDDFERYLKIHRAWRKLRLLLFWIRFVNEKRKDARERWAKIAA